MQSAPTTPVSWVFAPAASATGVRDELLLTGNRGGARVARVQTYPDQKEIHQ